ncbi:RNA 2',3'-cyclic phosphodiesterase [Pseudoduganella sp. RAF53_2]|uniref:RNA 2',3'-cyclic phosphodiesterase n=1 Tax=unclassified Pseudoduganella TaxID=2637179 RepID=UPI003F98A2ED
MIANHSSLKLFFALWPDTATRAALARLQAPVAGRHTPQAKLHLTMAFLGQQSADALPALFDILETVAVPPMRLVVDCYGYFTKPRIAWAGMNEPPAALLEMQAELMARLEASGFSAATHGAFKPHVTLAREAREAPPGQPPSPVTWDVRELALVESDTATGQYRPISRARTAGQ